MPGGPDARRGIRFEFRFALKSCLGGVVSDRGIRREKISRTIPRAVVEPHQRRKCAMEGGGVLFELRTCVSHGERIVEASALGEGLKSVPPDPRALTRRFALASPPGEATAEPLLPTPLRLVRRWRRRASCAGTKIVECRALTRRFASASPPGEARVCRPCLWRERRGQAQGLPLRGAEVSQWRGASRFLPPQERRGWGCPHPPPQGC